MQSIIAFWCTLVITGVLKWFFGGSFDSYKAFCLKVSAF